MFAAAHLVTAATTERPNAELRTLLIHAINDAGSFDDRYDAEVWLMDMTSRLEPLLAGKNPSVVARRRPARARQRLAAKIDDLGEPGSGAQPVAECVQGIPRAPGDHFDSAIGEIPCPHHQAQGLSPLTGGSTKTNALHAPADGPPAATLRHGITAGAA